MKSTVILVLYSATCYVLGFIVCMELFRFPSQICYEKSQTGKSTKEVGLPAFAIPDNLNEDMVFFNKNGLTTSMYKNHSVTVWTIFAGRQSSLELQIPYMRELLQNAIIDEVHIWDFTCKKDGPSGQEDKQFVRRIAQELPRTFLVVPKNCSWSLYYRFYADHSKEDDVILKVDDDIIFVDTSRIAGFVDMIRTHTGVFLWSANVINNGKSALFHRWDGTLRDVKVNVTEEAEMEGEGTGRFFQSKEFGRRVHLDFLSDSQRYMDPPKKIVREIKTRFSINFVGLLGRYAKDAYRLVLSFRHDDEHALTKIASNEEKRLMMYMPLVVSHASFGLQNIHQEMVERYKKANIRNKHSSWSLGNASKILLPTIPDIPSNTS